MRRKIALLPVAALFAATGVSAQGSPPAPQDRTSNWYVGLQQTFGHEEEVHVTPTTSSNTFSTTALRGQIDTTFSRQRLAAGGSVYYTKYDKSGDLLDHNGWDVY